MTATLDALRRAYEADPADAWEPYSDTLEESGDVAAAAGAQGGGAAPAGRRGAAGPGGGRKGGGGGGHGERGLSGALPGGRGAGSMTGTMARKLPKKRAGSWGAKLQKLRVRNGLTQAEAAAKVDVPLRTWISWENNHRNPSRLAVRALKQAFPEESL